MTNNDFNTSDAIERGDLDAIKRHVLSDPDFVRTTNECDETPLMTAVGSNEVGIVQFLLEHGANPNTAADDGYTCLLTAVESEHPESTAILRLLIAAGGNLHDTGIHGFAPLHMAANRGLTEKARVLIELGAEIDQRIQIDGFETPLMLAASCGSPATVQLLLDHGADPLLRDTMRKETPIEQAKRVLKGPDSEVHEYLKGQEFKTCFQEGIEFMRKGLSPEHMELLAKQMAQFDMAEHYQETSNSIVENGRHAEVIRILAEHMGETTEE